MEAFVAYCIRRRRNRHTYKDVKDFSTFAKLLSFRKNPSSSSIHQFIQNSQSSGVLHDVKAKLWHFSFSVTGVGLVADWRTGFVIVFNFLKDQDVDNSPYRPTGKRSKRGKIYRERERETFWTIANKEIKNVTTHFYFVKDYGVAIAFQLKTV